MIGYVANTDIDWFEFLSTRKDLTEVNFWQPSGSRHFRVVAPGAPFFFRLKSPYNVIGGFGFLSYSDILPAWLAWDTFGAANGAPTPEEMYRRIAKYRRQSQSFGKDYSIGCLMIVSPVFFERSQWLREPEGWHANIVQGKKLDLSQGDGRRLWEECQLHTSAQVRINEIHGIIKQRYGEPIEIRPRLGQGSFRIAVMEAYGKACAITTEHSLPVLESAHIKPYAEGGEHEVYNGILLRSDIHRLFDRGYVTVSPESKFIVSRRLKTEFKNGKSYYQLHGKELKLPSVQQNRPSNEMLIWHNENCYKE